MLQPLPYHIAAVFNSPVAAIFICVVLNFSDDLHFSKYHFRYYLLSILDFFCVMRHFVSPFIVHLLQVILYLLS